MKLFHKTDFFVKDDMSTFTFLVGILPSSTLRTFGVEPVTLQYKYRNIEEQKTREDRDTQPMDAGWLSFAVGTIKFPDLDFQRHLTLKK